MEEDPVKQEVLNTIDSESDSEYYDEAELVHLKSPVKEETISKSGYSVIKNPTLANTEDDVSWRSLLKKGKTFECDTCLKTFKTPKELRIHSRVHTNERPYQCKECDKAFKQKGALHDHMVTHTGLKNFQCQVCGGKFSTASSLKRHINRVHGKEKTFSCVLCDATFLNKSAYFEHKEVHFTDILHLSSEEVYGMAQNDGCYRCPLCQRTFKKRSRLFLHLDVHTDVLHVCNYCGESFTYLALKSHTKRAHAKQYCDICREEFLDRKLFHMHVNTHFRIDLDTCDYCNVSFPSDDLLQAHMKSEHCGKDSFQCDVCVKTYSKSKHLQKHTNLVHISCKICKKYFVDHMAISIHYRNGHPSQNSFKCRKCKAILVTKARLAFHLNTVHLIIGTFPCRICKKRFHRYINLHRHKMLHNKKTKSTKGKSKNNDDKIVKYNLCSVCVDANGSSKNFPNKRTLHRHIINMHPESAEKAIPGLLQCKLCSKYFFSRTEMLDHIYTHLRQSEFKCSVCSAVFLHFNKLEKHIVGEHPDAEIHRCSCGKGFALEKALYRHSIRMHKTYICVRCLQTFSNGRALRDHKRKSFKCLRVRSFDCSVCNVEVQSSRGLKRHIRMCHLLPENAPRSLVIGIKHEIENMNIKIESDCT